MRNVNAFKKAYIRAFDKSFILTMRNVNVDKPVVGIGENIVLY